MKLIRDVKMLYCTNYYDYPRSGWLEWQGKRYYFKETYLDSEMLNLLDLTEEEWSVEDHNHNLWNELVGNHWDYVDAKRVKDPVIPNKYEEYKSRRIDHGDYSNHEPVAVWDRRICAIYDYHDTKEFILSVEDNGLIFEMNKFEDGCEEYISLTVDKSSRHNVIKLRDMLTDWLEN